MTKQFWVTIVAAIGIDYFIAKWIASDETEVMFVFLVLLIAPLLFAIKSAVVRYLMWKILWVDAGVEHYRHMMKEQNWPKPEPEHEDALNYLNRVLEDKEIREKPKFVAAQLMGALQVLFDTKHLMSAWFEMSMFKKAMKKYEKEFI